MATYSTDLTLMTDAESGTWGEFVVAATGGTPAADGENFIQGLDCYSQTTGTKSGLKSIVFDYGSDIASTLAAGDVILMWLVYAVGANLQPYASDGIQVGVGADLTDVDLYTVGGADYGRNPYGGWFNAAVDPIRTQDNVYGAGNGGVFRWFGSVMDTIAAISKGAPHAVDAIRYGRGEIAVTGTGAEFTTMAEYNDYNQASAHPSSGDSDGYNRFGLFQDSGGTYLWKGLMSLGQSATSVTFSDSNKTITIDDAAKTYASFNKIEINHASSSVTLTNITLIALGTVAAGNFEMIDNATVNMTGCSFNSMGTFIFQSNGTLENCVFNSCSSVTVGGGSFDGCSFNELTGASAVIAATPAEATSIQNSVFNSSGSGNGLEITGTATNITLTGLDFVGYSTTVDADKAIFVNIASGSIELNISGGSGVTAASHVRTAGATVTVVSGAVNVTVKTTDTTGVDIASANVMLRAADGTGPFPYKESVTIARSGTVATVSHTGHGMANNDKVEFKGITDKKEDNNVRQITVIDTNSYSFTTTDSGSTIYTGTIVATFVALQGLTNGSGIITASRTYASNQPVTGWARKSSASPYYRQAGLSGTIDSSTGFSATPQLILDE